MILYRIVAKDFVAGVVTDRNIIVETAPKLKVFKGQPIGNLEKWANKNGMKIERLSK